MISNLNLHCDISLLRSFFHTSTGFPILVYKRGCVYLLRPGLQTHNSGTDKGELKRSILRKKLAFGGGQNQRIAQMFQGKSVDG